LFCIALLVVTVAAVAQGAIGMGFGQIGAAGMVWIVPEMIPAIVIIMAFAVATIGVLREPKKVNIQALSFSMCGRIAGTIMALPLLIQVATNRDAFNFLFGVLLLVSVSFSLFKIKPAFTPVSQVTGGLASGLMGTITSVGAPPMALVFQDQKAEMARPTLNGFFAIGAPVSLIILWLAGRLNPEQFIFAGYLAPGFILGLYLSTKLNRFVDHRFRYLVLAFSFISALALIMRSLP
jgi:uncharacterized membrane protein YfcA